MKHWRAFAGVAWALWGEVLVSGQARPTLFVAGDSTAKLANHQGWGDPLADYFDLTKITVINRACGGRSAEAEDVPFVDVTNIIAGDYERMGQLPVQPLFIADRTHTTQAGADPNASLIVAGLKGIRSPLAQLLSTKGQSVVASDR